MPLRTCRVNIDRTVSFSFEDRYDGMLGIRPELTIVISSGWLRAVAKGDLRGRNRNQRNDSNLRDIMNSR
jgi:ATP phosphoribosyltransferase regulatory subunit HisZ